MRYFYGVYPRNRGFALFLDLLRFVAEPNAVRKCHITLRGPYKHKLEKYRLDSIKRRAKTQSKVTLLEPLTFFSDGQNTVVIDVDVEGLRSVWYKPDYPHGNGHVTMYDGSSRSEAARIMDALIEYDWRMSVSVTDVQLLEPKISDSSGFLAGMNDIYRAYDKFSNIGLPPLAAVPQLSFGDRLQIYSALLARSELPVRHFAPQAQIHA